MRGTAVTFNGVEHRIEPVRELRGVKYYNDSIASSPSRTIAGLKALAETKRSSSAISGNPGTIKKIILIAGGKDKGISFDELGTEIVKNVKILILTGAAADQIYEAVINSPEYNFGYYNSCEINSHGNNSSSNKSPENEPHKFKCPGNPVPLKIIRCDNFKDAVLTASKHSEKGDIVLLSPACTSFDMFNNFEERGKMFKDIVNNLV